MEKKYSFEGQDSPNSIVEIEKEGVSEHHHEHGCCDHHHEHHHEHGCCDHHHEHHSHHHGCSCGHDHSHHDEAILEKRERKIASSSSLRVKWRIEGLDCANCALKVEDAVSQVKGVETVSLNFTTKSLLYYVECDEDVEQVKKDVRQAILNVEDVEIIENQQAPVKMKENRGYIVVIGILLFILGFILKQDLMVIVSYFFVGSSVIIKAFKNIRRKEVFDENFLMVVATIGAIVIGEYLEAVAVMIFYQVGEYFQNKAVESSRRSISQLMDIKSDIARLKVGNDFQEVDPEEVKIGEVIQIRPGERVPLDGILIQGETSLDTSALTGESMPRNVCVKDEVLAGCINLNGIIEIEVTSISSESTVSRILDMVENASNKKAKTELKMTRFARIYTPIVVIAAFVLAIVPNFFYTGIEWQEWLRRACTFLVISCPCALVLSIPLGYFAGIGSASKKGILVKGGNYLEVLKDIDTIVFDKTGTLTKGTFKVTRIISKDKTETLKLAALAESYSTHPIALSILNEYGDDINPSEIKGLEEKAGYGMKGEVNGKELLVGNEKLMSDHEIAVETIASDGTLVYVAYDHQLMGIIEINDTLKENTKESLKQLKEKGIKKLVMLTGDRKETAMRIAKECGIDEVHYELLPTEKVNELEKILNRHHKIAYVGDGINDAPVLARSDLGIAMGGLGSEAAVEASDIVLMNDDLSALPKGIEIAKKTQRIMNQNITFILLVKGCVLLLGIFGYANMWLGVFADVGVSILAVLNAMRILRN